MIIKRLILFLFILSIVGIVSSCCHCKEITYDEYTNCRVELHNISKLAGESDTITANEYILRVIVYRSQEDLCDASVDNYFFISSANAAIDCFCPPDVILLPIDSIVSLKVITVKDFDDDYSSGSDITKLFSIYKYQSYISIDDFLRDEHKEIEYDSYALPFEDAPFYIDMKLMKSPNSEEQKFMVEVELSDGRILKSKIEVELML